MDFTQMIDEHFRMCTWAMIMDDELAHRRRVEQYLRQQTINQARFYKQMEKIMAETSAKKSIAEINEGYSVY